MILVVVQVQEETGDAANCNMFTGTNNVDKVESARTLTQNLTGTIEAYLSYDLFFSTGSHYILQTFISDKYQNPSRKPLSSGHHGPSHFSVSTAALESIYS